MRNSTRWRGLLPQTSLVLLASGISFALAGLASVYIARTLEPIPFGRWAYFSSIFLIGAILTDFGLSLKLTIELATAVDGSERSRRFYSLLACKLTTFAMLGALGLAAAALLREPIVLALVFATALSGLNGFLLSALQGLQRPRAVVVNIIVQPAVYLGLLFAAPAAGAEAVFVALSVSYLLAATGEAAAIAGSGLLSLPSRGSFNLPYLRRSLWSIFDLYAIGVLEIAFALGGVLVIGASERFTLSAELLAVLTPIRILPLLCVPLMSTLFFPRFCMELAQAARPAALRTLDAFGKGLIAIALGATALLAAQAGPVLRVLYAGHYATADSLLELLSPLAFLLTIEALFTLALIAAGAARKALWILTARVALLAALLWAAVAWSSTDLHPPIALAYLASGALALVLQLRQVRMVLGYALPIGRSLIAALCAVTAAFALEQLWPFASNRLFESAAASLISAFIVMSLCAGVMLARTRMVAA